MRGPNFGPPRLKAMSHWQVKHESARESRLQKQERLSWKWKTFMKHFRESGILSGHFHERVSRKRKTLMKHFHENKRLSWNTIMKVFRESGILVIAVLIAEKGIYVTAFTIVQETFTKRKVVYLCKFLAQVFKRTMAFVQCTLSLYEYSRHINHLIVQYASSADNATMYCIYIKIMLFYHY